MMRNTLIGFEASQLLQTQVAAALRDGEKIIDGGHNDDKAHDDALPLVSLWLANAGDIERYEGAAFGRVEMVLPLDGVTKHIVFMIDSVSAQWLHGRPMRLRTHVETTASGAERTTIGAFEALGDDAVAAQPEPVEAAMADDEPLTRVEAEWSAFIATWRAEHRRGGAVVAEKPAPPAAADDHPLHDGAARGARRRVKARRLDAK